MYYHLFIYHIKSNIIIIVVIEKEEMGTYKKISLRERIVRMQ